VGQSLEVFCYIDSISNSPMFVTWGRKQTLQILQSNPEIAILLASRLTHILMMDTQLYLESNGNLRDHQ
jgi:hypothetical protein